MSGSVVTTRSTRLVWSEVEPTPTTPIESMSPRWYSSFKPPPTVCWKSASIDDSNNGVTSKRFLTSKRRWRTATSFARLLVRRGSANASVPIAPTNEAPINTSSVGLVIGFIGDGSPEGGVFERGREPEAQTDLEHDVVDERAVGIGLRLRRSRVAHQRAVRRLELVDEQVVADAEVDREPLREEEAHVRADVRLDQEVREAGERLVARHDLGLTDADAGGKVRLPRDQLVVEHGELAVYGHVVEIERGRPVVLVDRRQATRLARDQVVGLLERVDVV